MLALLASPELGASGLPIAVRTAVASGVAALWRIGLTPVDTLKTTLQAAEKPPTLAVEQCLKMTLPYTSVPAAHSRHTLHGARVGEAGAGRRGRGRSSNRLTAATGEGTGVDGADLH